MSLGVIVGSNAKLEWLLPYFYLHFRLHSDLPLTFFDFGMSALGRNFCEKRGAVIEVQDSLWTLPLTEASHARRKAYFQKPLACQKAPYDTNLWLDIDTQLRGPLEPIFKLLSQDKWIVIAKEFDVELTKDMPISGFPIFNSGVFAFRKDCPLIDLWAELCKITPLDGIGDQDILSFELFKALDKVAQLPLEYNHMFLDKNTTDPKTAHILHYQAKTKEVLLSHYQILEKLASKGAYV